LKVTKTLKEAVLNISLLNKTINSLLPAVTYTMPNYPPFI